MFHNLVEETDAKVIGRVDGSAVIIRETPALAILESIQEGRAVDANLKLDCFKIKHKAKLLDVLSLATAYNTTGLLVSEKFKNVIEALNLCEAQFIPVEAEYKDSIINTYYLLLLTSYAIEKIDLSKTLFGKYWPAVPHYRLEEEYGHITKSKLNDLWKELAGSLYILRPVGHYHFNEFEPSAWDMFTIGQFDSRIVVSDAFKEHVQAAKLSGFYLSPIEQGF